MSVVLADQADGVLTLTFNRPERLNAWTDEMTRLYFDHLQAAEAHPEVRVIVVTGAGRGFCSGADFEVLASVQDGSIRPTDKRPTLLPTTIKKPIIAAVNGPCAGLGMAHALMCDLVFTADTAKWTTSFPRRGLIAEYGLSWIMPRLVGQVRAMDLLLSGRPFTGADAVEYGLAARAVPVDRLLDETLAYARDLAVNCSPASMAVIKSQVWGDWNVDLKTAHVQAVHHMLESFGRPDFMEGTASFLERREPRFPPLPA